MAGYSLRDLESAVGKSVSYNALAKYEKGEMMPSSDVLIQIADALNLSIDFFFRNFELSIDRVRFRKQTKLRKKTEESVLAKAKDFFERYFEIEEITNDINPFKPIFKSHESPIDLERVNELADEARKRLNLGGDPIPNVHELLESIGIKVYIIDNPGEGFDGCSAYADNRPIVVLAKNENLMRLRMTATHELAHILLEPLLDGLGEEEEEKVVRAFAGAFLLPEKTFESLFGTQRNHFSLGELINLKVYFGTSISAIMMRAKSLQLISPGVNERFWKLHGSKWKTAKREPGDEKYCGNETHGRFRQLVLRAVSEGLISTSQGAASMDVSLDQFRELYLSPCI